MNRLREGGHHGIACVLGVALGFEGGNGVGRLFLIAGMLGVIFSFRVEMRFFCALGIRIFSGFAISYQIGSVMQNEKNRVAQRTKRTGNEADRPSIIACILGITFGFENNNTVGANFL